MSAAFAMQEGNAQSVSEWVVQRAMLCFSMFCLQVLDSAFATETIMCVKEARMLSFVLRVSR